MRFRFPFIQLCLRLGVVALMLPLLLPAPARTAPAGPTYKGDPAAIAEVQAAYRKFGAARTWRARITGEGNTMIMEYVAPDRYHMILGAGTQMTEIFSIAGEMWTKASSGCSKLPARVRFPNPKDYMEHSTDTTLTVTRGGRDTVDGTATQTYGVVTESPGTTTQQKLHVATATGFPRRVEVASSRGTTLVDYADFDAAIKVEPPC